MLNSSAPPTFWSSPMKRERDSERGDRDRGGERESPHRDNNMRDGVAGTRDTNRDNRDHRSDGGGASKSERDRERERRMKEEEDGLDGTGDDEGVGEDAGEGVGEDAGEGEGEGDGESDGEEGALPPSSSELSSKISL